MAAALRSWIFDVGGQFLLQLSIDPVMSSAMDTSTLREARKTSEELPTGRRSSISVP
ncbi:hypothetical protein D3C71_1382850 [compost metagenome]